MSNTINILTDFQQFLKTEIKYFFKTKKDYVRKYYNIPANDKLWFNGFDYKPIIFINNNKCLNKINVPIQRMIWKKKKLTHKHIYLYPSFVMKYCPFSLETIEYIWNNCTLTSTEPFDIIDDPKNLLETSILLEHHTKKVFNIINTSDYSGAWNNLYYNTFQALPVRLPNISFSNYMYKFIKLFADKINLKLSKYNYLSFANFQIAFK